MKSMRGWGTPDGDWLLVVDIPPLYSNQIKNFMKTIDQIAIGEDGLPFGWFTPIEGKAYQDAIIKANGPVIEVGTFFGRSTYFAGQACAKINAKLTCVDLWNLDKLHHMEKRACDWNDPFKVFLWNMRHFNINVHHTLSVSSLSASERFEDNSIGLVMIDADHSFDAVSADIIAWHKKVKVGGILCGHDYNYKTNRPVVMAVDQLLGRLNVKVTDSFWEVVKHV